MKRTIVYSFHLLAIAVCLAAVACSHSEKKPETKVVKVHVLEVKSGSMPCGREYVGTVEGAAASELSFSTAGRVTAVYVKEGQQVRKGTLLASVDKTTATSSYKMAKATLDQARDGYARAKQVHDQGSLPEVKWVEIQTDVQKAESMYEIAQQNLADCDLYAPHDGTVDSRSVERGTSVVPYQPVMRLLDLSHLYVRISVPDVDITKIHNGDTAQVFLSSMADGDAPIAAIVEEQAISADRVSHGYSVRLRLTGHPKGVLPGMVGRVRFAQEEIQGQMEIPNRAVQLTHEGERYVWVANEGVAQRRKVTIADLSRTGVLVSEGLREGDLVVTDGMSKISNGTLVEIER